MSVVVLSRFRVANGMEADVARAFRERPREVESAPGFLGLEVLVDAGDPAVFYLFTRWTDRGSFERWHDGPAHRSSHALIPKGLKLDAAWTERTDLVRVEGVIGAPVADAIQDATLLLAQFVDSSASLHLYRLDRDGTVRACNPAGCAELTGGAPLAGRSILEYMPAADAARLRDLLAVPGRSSGPALLNFAAPRKVPYTLECWLDVQPDGATLVGEPTFRRDQLLHDSLMAMNQELAVLSRERSREAGEERRGKETAQRLNDERNAFLTVLAHELRQPVGGALAALGVLRKMHPDSRLDRPRAHLERQLAQIQRLVEDLADTARVAGGQVELRCVELDLGRLLREIATSWESRAEQEQKPFALSVPERPVHVFADAHRLTQVFSNIVGNAFKYTPPGGAVNVGVRRDTRWAIVSVQDEGEGIPAERLGRVFDLFQRATTSAAGLGVGLAVVRGLVEAHGGTVTAESGGTGLGATFVVRLPLVSA